MAVQMYSLLGIAIATAFTSPLLAQFPTEVNADDWIHNFPAQSHNDQVNSIRHNEADDPGEATHRKVAQSAIDVESIFRGQSCDSSVSQDDSCFAITEEDEFFSFRLTEFNIYPTFSHLGSQSATYNEFEFASKGHIGFLEYENRTVMNVADLPSSISLGPTNPDLGLPSSVGVRANGFGDILNGTFFSLKGREKSPVHVGVGPVITFPTASNEILGSNQYSAGPGLHASTELENLTLGLFIWQSWGFGEDPGKKRINQLFGKPFIIYEMTEKWHLVYIPLGLSHSWKSKSGDDWTVPVGGGIRRMLHIGDQKVGIQFQVFDYVARKPKDPEWEYRFTFEFLFDD